MTYSKRFNNNDLLVNFDKMEIEAVDKELSNHHMIYLTKDKKVIATMFVDHKPQIKKTYEHIHLDNKKVIYFEVI